MNTTRGIARRIELAVDVLLTSLAFVFAYVIKGSLLAEPLGGLSTDTNYYLVLFLIVIIWYVTLDFLHIRLRYSTRISTPLFIEFFKGVVICMIVLILCLYMFKIRYFSRLLLFMFFILDIIFLVLGRWMTYRFIFAKRTQGYFHRYVLILGSRTTAKELIRMIKTQSETEIRIVGCIDVNRDDVGKIVWNGVTVMGTLDDLREILLTQVVDEVLITMPLNEIQNSDWYLSFIQTFGITIRIIPYWYIRKFLAIKPDSHEFKVDQFLSEPALVLGTIQDRQDSLVIKFIMDYMIAAAALIITFPLFLIFPLLIKLFSPGPIFYRQIRCGQYGRKFSVIKFRTMILDAENCLEDLQLMNECDGPAFKMKKDPRIIPYIGTFLRRFGLDELPQFVNVLRGEMSVVGPRPPIPSEVEQYELWQRRRLSMKPGLTCIWQIQPNRNDFSFDQWMDMDLKYIDSWTVWMDLVLIIKTIPAMLMGHGR
jgi:exopolysaccharide biosynthesis polyprenyl glycosylphosphotransferase